MSLNSLLESERSIIYIINDYCHTANAETKRDWPIRGFFVSTTDAFV